LSAVIPDVVVLSKTIGSQPISRGGLPCTAARHLGRARLGAFRNQLGFAAGLATIRYIKENVDYHAARMGTCSNRVARGFERRCSHRFFFFFFCVSANGA
jgi:4-aminobutyrate aminotransferase-like enzyme